MSVAGVYLEEVEVLTCSQFVVQPYKSVDVNGGICIGIRDGSFRFEDKHIIKILKGFDKEELNVIFNKLKEEGYV